MPEILSLFILLARYNQLGKSNDLDHSSHLLTVATRDLFNDLDKNVKPVAPMQFWMVLTLFSLLIFPISSLVMTL